MTAPLALVLGGGDIGSAVAHALFSRGACVLVCELPQSAHARRGMSFTDALFEGRAVLEQVEGRLVSEFADVRRCWADRTAIPITTLGEEDVLHREHFNVLIEATLRRNRVPPDLRGQADLFIGLGPGYRPGTNCDVAIETQWGPALGEVLVDRETAPRSGGPAVLGGLRVERFVEAPAAGLWRTDAVIGQRVEPGEPVGRVDEHVVRAPVRGHLRGLTHDGVVVRAGQRIVEVDPRAAPQLFGLGERPLAIARGVTAVLQVHLRESVT